jgi:hypothetical protein
LRARIVSKGGDCQDLSGGGETEQSTSAVVMQVMARSDQGTLRMQSQRLKTMDD